MRMIAGRIFAATGFGSYLFLAVGLSTHLHLYAAHRSTPLANYATHRCGHDEHQDDGPAAPSSNPGECPVCHQLSIGSSSTPAVFEPLDLPTGEATRSLFTADNVPAPSWHIAAIGPRAPPSA